MSSGNILAGAILKGGSAARKAVGARQSTMNDVHAVAIQNHYAAVVHQNEHAQHLEAVKQAHEIAGDRGFTVHTNNRMFQVGGSSKKGKTKSSENESTPAAETATPESTPEAGTSSRTMADFNAKKKARGLTGGPKAPKSGVAGQKSGIDENVWRMGTSGVDANRMKSARASAGSAVNAAGMRNRIRKTAANPQILSRGENTTPEQLKMNVSKAWQAKAAVRRWDGK